MQTTMEPRTNETMACAACGTRGTSIVLEQGAAPCNVRAFLDQWFTVWRCRQCLSIHAREEVDLVEYYRQYPFHNVPDDPRLRVVYDRQLGRLKRAGVRPEHRILDYGCGAGAFIKHLRLRGFSNAFGYDRYSKEFEDPAVLDQRYDCIISQDVVEHVANPQALLDEFDRLLARDGVVAIGTPNAEAIDLGNIAPYVHSLHLPYHRHIFSKRALMAAGTARGWRCERYYRTPYADTAIPFINTRFFAYYMRLRDDSLDSLMEAPRLAPLLARLPLTLFWGFFGKFFADESDIMIVFRTATERGVTARD
jgi:SAM-dependent methyltransferase